MASLNRNDDVFTELNTMSLKDFTSLFIQKEKDNKNSSYNTKRPVDEETYVFYDEASKKYKFCSYSFLNDKNFKYYTLSEFNALVTSGELVDIEVDYTSAVIKDAVDNFNYGYTIPPFKPSGLICATGVIDTILTNNSWKYPFSKDLLNDQ